MSAAAVTTRKVGAGFWAFIVLMLALTVLWIGLGVWQLDRLRWKEGLIAEVTTRLTQPPYELPPAAQWPALDLDSWAYHPVSATGQFLGGQTVLVFTSLSDARGKYSGAGYWVMTPLRTADGVVFVNRGFVPQESAAAFAEGGTVTGGTVTVSGVALPAEAAGAFTPAADRVHRIDWVRDPVRLAAMAGITDPVFGMTLDLPAGDAGALPQGGETTIDFPNNHLGYALTWFGFALLTPALLAYWVFRQLRPKAKA